MKSWAPVTGSFHPRHRQHLRQDDLFHYLRQVAVQQVDFRDVARHQFELDSHVEGHFEAVARRKFHCAADAEDFGFLRDVVRRLFPAGGGSLFYRPFQGFQPLLILEIQRLGFQCAECVVRAVQPGAGRHHALVGAGGHGDLIHADFDHVDLVGVPVQVVEAGLQDILEHSLFTRTGEVSRRRFPARLRSHHADIADRNIHRVGDFDLIPLRIQPVKAGAEHIAPYALAFAVGGDDLARRQFAADFGGHDADLAQRYGNRRHDFHVVLDRIQEMPSLGQHLAPDPLFALFDQNRTDPGGSRPDLAVTTAI